MSDTKIELTQVRSVIGQSDRQRKTLRGLGLRRRHHTVVVKDTPAIRGMITKVQHLLEVRVLSGAPEPFGQRHKNPTKRRPKAE